MKVRNVGDKVSFYFKGVLCHGEIVAVNGNLYTVSFVYKPNDGRAPESVIYDITDIDVLSV